MDTRPVGVVLARAPRLFGTEPFHMELLGGLEEVLAEADRAVLLQVVADLDSEMTTYRRWAGQRAVAAVVVVNIVADDPRAALLRELGLPALALAPVTGTLALPRVTVDGAAAMREAVAALAALGHRRIGRVSGPANLLHTLERDTAFAAACEAAGATHAVAVADYGEETGARAAAELLDASSRPTALIFDNDVMALAGLRVATERGLDVPRDLSLVAWDDSTLCRLATPPLSAMSLDVHVLGREVGSRVLAILAGDDRSDQAATAHRFLARGSTGPAPEPDAG